MPCPRGPSSVQRHRPRKLRSCIREFHILRAQFHGVLEEGDKLGDDHAERNAHIQYAAFFAVPSFARIVDLYVIIRGGVVVQWPAYLIML